MLGKQRRRFLLYPVRRRTTAGNQDRHRLKEDFAEFAKEDRIKDIIKKYSAFVQFPVSVNGEKVNTVDAIWMRSKNEIKDEEYDEFYKFQSNDFEPLDAYALQCGCSFGNQLPSFRSQTQHGEDGDVQKRK